MTSTGIVLMRMPCTRSRATGRTRARRGGPLRYPRAGGDDRGRATPDSPSAASACGTTTAVEDLVVTGGRPTEAGAASGCVGRSDDLALHGAPHPHTRWRRAAWCPATDRPAPHRDSAAVLRSGW